MKKFLLSFQLICTSLFGQSDPNSLPHNSKVPFESEIISLNRIDGYYSVNYIYKIPYRILVFERQGESFIAGFRVSVEILDEESKLIARDIKDSRVIVGNFADTHDYNLHLQDYLSFNIKPGKYKITALISDINSRGDSQIKPVDLNLESEEGKKVFNPLVIAARELTCDNRKAFVLANSGGNLPFSSEKFHLIIPVIDTSINDIEIEIENNDEIIISTKVNEAYIMPIGIAKCERYLSISGNAEIKATKNFLLRNVNDKLKEGGVIIRLKKSDISLDEEFTMNAVWFNKPLSLIDPEKAIEFLNNIESDSVVNSMLKNRSSQYLQVLNDYWRKYDPTPETTFNEVMFEYYSRVDYAIREFRGIGKAVLNGAKTDRGMVYIKFGKPGKVERSSNLQGQVLEIWTYSNPERKFSFIDKKGTGNFTLIEN